MNSRIVGLAVGYLACLLLRNRAIRPAVLERPWLGGF